MSNSPAWDDINPTARPTPLPSTPPATLHDAARRIRGLTEFAAQLTHEGQLDRARNYLAQAADILGELK